MAKVSGPLYSIDAKGTFADSLVFRSYESGHGHRNRVNFKGIQKPATGLEQSKKESGVKEVQKVWQSLNYGEKQTWQYVAYSDDDYSTNRGWKADLSAYHKFMSYGMQAYLNDNPIPRTIIDVSTGFGKDRFGLDPFGHEI